ncbi:MAG: hypothetical protein O2943_06960 [Actinomycetota bacterium]|nr:hypothetical protein [Actinomycetota bacterium]
MFIRVVLAGLSALVLAVMLAAPAHAHQPVILDEKDSSPAKGPLLVDGTVSFAVYATVARGQERGFRFQLGSGERLALQYLILDEPPANALPQRGLPRVTLIDPKGRRSVLAVTERTKFYEPYSKRTYLYLSRVEQNGLKGTYKVIVRGRSTAPVLATMAVGYREVPGTVVE